MTTCGHMAICAALAAVVAIMPHALAQPAPQPSVPQVNVAAVPPATDDASALAEKLQNPVGDLISVPAGTRHWFDMGPTPRFTAIRLFTTPAGWVADFTGTPIARSFPSYGSAPA